MHVVKGLVDGFQAHTAHSRNIATIEDMQAHALHKGSPDWWRLGVRSANTGVTGISACSAGP